jgi:interferon-induced GTP-binding protein Mx1
VKCSKSVRFKKVFDVDLFIVSFVGVITKPDLVDAGSEPELIATITNNKIPLKKGYVCVRCRGQDALNKGMTLEHAIAVEEEYFATTEHFK